MPTATAKSALPRTARTPARRATRRPGPRLYPCPGCSGPLTVVRDRYGCEVVCPNCTRYTIR